MGDDVVSDSAELARETVYPDPLAALREAQVEICYRAPGSHEWKRWNVRVSDLQAENLSPLPRNREIAWEVNEQERAARMVAMRHRIAGDVARVLAEKLLDMFAAGDPVNGYSPEQWAAIKKTQQEG